MDSENSFRFSNVSAAHLIPVDYSASNIEYRLSCYMNSYYGGYSAGYFQPLLWDDHWQKIIYYKKCSGGIQTLNNGLPIHPKYFKSFYEYTYDQSINTDLGTIVTDADMEDAIFYMYSRNIRNAWIRLNHSNLNLDVEGIVYVY